MSQSDMRALRIQQVRRCVLRVLLEAYSLCALEGTQILALVLEQYPDVAEEDLRKDLTYLMEDDKGYVETEGPVQGVSWRDRRYKLTGKGNEIANRLDRDPALGI